ncbi:hypothetical protein [Streptomyces prunicolor]|uniref:hypothetical protein n=1 Tax=Streptomyces prunicolor TaxID=67348 RepID=UPI001319E2D0|nr:hypothetical protein [Streptomyces prunicolor]
MRDVRQAWEHVTPSSSVSARRTTTTPHPTHGVGGRTSPRPTNSVHRTAADRRASSGRDSPLTGSGHPLP